MSLLHIILVVVAIQQVLDVWTTKTALATGRAREANGPLDRLMGKIGVMPALLSTKVFFVGFLVFNAQATVAWYVVLGLIVALYTYVLVNNFRVLRKLGAL